jgi:hypothetical protein
VRLPAPPLSEIPELLMVQRHFSRLLAELFFRYATLMVMKMTNVSNGELHISIDREEMLILNNALNEVCNGLALFEFETRMGASRSRVTQLLKEVHSVLKAVNIENE